MTDQQRFAEALDLALQYVDFREPDEVELALAATLRELRDAVLKGQEMFHHPAGRWTHHRETVSDYPNWRPVLVIPLDQIKP